LYSIKSFVFVFLEIPSGVIADIIGKNNANIFARFMIIPSLIVFVFANSFWMFAVANLLMHIGNVFKSGTHKAIIFDYLKEHPKIKKSYPQLIGRTKVFSRVGEGAAALIGAAVASIFGFRLVFAVSLVPAVLNFLNALSYEKTSKERTKKRNVFRVKEYANHLKKSLLFLKKHPLLVVLMINSSIIFFSWSISMIILQPFLAREGIHLANFGVIYMILLSAAAIASEYSDYIGRLLGKKKAMNCLGWLMVIPFFILGGEIDSMILLVSFILVNFAKSAYHPIMINEIASSVDKNKRATVLSIAAMFGAVLYLVILPVTGYIIDISNLSIVSKVIASVLVLNQIFFYFSFKKTRMVENMP